MTRIFSCTVLFILMCGQFLSAQTVLKGYVQDQNTGERLPYATVSLTGTGKGAVSNEHGYFYMSAAAGAETFTVSFVGYQSRTLPIGKLSDSLYIIELKPNNLLETVEVSASKTEGLQELSSGNYLLPMKQVQEMPQPFGEADVMRTIQTLPGVVAGSEASSGFYVRGGSPDQNLILLDDVPIFNAGHLFGIFSVFNTDALKAANFKKGGISSRYGGRLSSVLDLRLKDGNENAHHGKLSVGIASAKLFAEGPLKKQRATYMVAARRSYIDMFMRAQQHSKYKNSHKLYRDGFYFYDLLAKVSIKLGTQDRLYLSAYNSSDKLYHDSDKKQTQDYKSYGMQWANFTSAVRWNHAFGKRTFSNLTATYMRYGLQLWNDKHIQDSTTLVKNTSLYSTGLQDVSLKTEFTTYINNGKLYYGWTGNLRWFNMGKNYYQNVMSLDPYNETVVDMTLGLQRINENSTFIGINQKLFGFAYDIGLRGTHYIYHKKGQLCIEPRAALTYRFLKHFNARVTYDAMSQNLHLLTSAAQELSTELWVPATDSFPPSRSHIYATGVSYHKSHTSVSIDGFYKRMNGVLEYITAYGFDAGDVEWEKQVLAGKGTAYGAEMLLQHRFRKLSLRLAYTLSKNRRTFPYQINQGKPFPYKYDRTHDLDLSITYRLSQKWNISTTWVYATGIATNVPQARYWAPATRALINGQANSGYIYDYGNRNSYRLPAYHRLDLNFVWKPKPMQPKGSTWQFGVYNAYNRANPYSLSIQEYADGPKFYQRSLLYMFPFINYSYEF